MTDLVERLRNPLWVVNWHSDYTGALDKEAILETARKAADALEAAQAQAAEVRRETIAECAKKATSFLVGDPFNGIPLQSPSPHQIADAIRALTDAAKEDRT